MARLTIECTQGLSIAAIERDTGLSKDTLRVWERRYGFPVPARDAGGGRTYSLDQLRRLRVIKRLLDAGHRPGHIVGLPIDELQHLAESSGESPVHRAGEQRTGADAGDLLSLLRQHELLRLRAELARRLAGQGVQAFIDDVVVPLNVAVGDAWMRGQLQVYQEHLYSEVVQSLLRQAVASIPAPSASGAPRVLLTTLPGEPHSLGLLMAEAVLALHGCAVVSLGPQTPLPDIVQAASALDSDIVALGLTLAPGSRRIHEALAELRARLPAAVRLWVGGSGARLQRRSIDGVELIDSLARLPGALPAVRTHSAGFT